MEQQQKQEKKNPPRIYLEPICPECEVATEDRQWCQDNIWDRCENCNQEIKSDSYVLEQRVLFGKYPEIDHKSEWPAGTFNLDYFICKEIGERLLFLSENMQGCPVDFKPDEWSNTIKKHGKALLDYCVSFDNLDHNYVANKAKEALQWVANYLENLWD